MKMQGARTTEPFERDHRLTRLVILIHDNLPFPSPMTKRVLPQPNSSMDQKARRNCRLGTLIAAGFRTRKSWNVE